MKLTFHFRKKSLNANLPVHFMHNPVNKTHHQQELLSISYHGGFSALAISSLLNSATTNIKFSKCFTQISDNITKIIHDESNIFNQ